MAKKQIEFDYFHDYESEQFAFYRIPKVLFTDDYFKSLSSDAKVLYGLMLDRMALSIRNQWVDDEGKVYIIFTLEQVMQYMNCGKDKGVKIMAELDTEKGIGLIQRVKRGLGKPTIIYVKSFIIREKTEYSQDIPKTEEDMTEAGQPEKSKPGLPGEVAETGHFESRSPEFGNAEVKTSEKPKSGVFESRSPEVGKTEVKTSGKPKSGVLENRSPEVGKTDSNYTYNNNTDISDTDRSEINLINPSREQQRGQADRIDEMAVIQAYTDIVKSNIDYEVLIQGCRIGDREYIDEIVELLVETISIKRDTLVINGAEHPYQFVKNKLLKIDFAHVQYVLECMHDNTTKIHNVRAYLLACLFNAPSTINSYYRAEVNHDMYGGGIL